MSIFETYEGPVGEGEAYEGETYEGEAYEAPLFEALNEAEYAGEVFELSEGEVNELAMELMEVTSEEELDRFLGNLFKKIGRGARAVFRSPVFKSIGGVLKSVAKKALPLAGAALGSFVAPGVGTAIGGKLGSLASGLLEVQEYESMGEEEAEFEAARRYVRWASGTVRHAARAPRGMPPRAVARNAAIASARRHAPALLRRRRGPVPPRRPVARRPYPTPAPSRPAVAWPVAPAWQPPAPDVAGPYPDWPSAPAPSWDQPPAPQVPASDFGEPGGFEPGMTGRWIRQDGRIVLLDVRG